MELEDLYEKYSILTDGLERRYVINPFERRYDMDHVTPVQLQIAYQDNKNLNNTDLVLLSGPNVETFEYRSWSQLILQLVNYLQNRFPKTTEELLNFKSDWSKACVFSDHKSFNNMVEMDNGLYVSVNYTSTHSLWIIGDLLDFYGVGCGALIVHRPPKAEPQEIRDVVEAYRKKDFVEYLVSKYGFPHDRADRISNGVQSLNKLLIKMGTSYDNFYLFQSTQDFSNYKSRVLLDYKKYVSWTEEQVKTMKRYLDYLTDYYNNEMKKAKNNRENLEYELMII